MKNGKNPTLEQKRIIQSHGLSPDEWLVVKTLPTTIEVISRRELKKYTTGRRKTKILEKFDRSVSKKQPLN